jgi:inositol phosphorylceramide mannosyltransferase catalytic subunit
MRRSPLLFLLFLLIIVALCINWVWILLTLLFIDGSADAISRAELPGPNSNVPEHREQLIPKIIHQTYINESIPERWNVARQSCLDLHEDYEYKVR